MFRFAYSAHPRIALQAHTFLRSSKEYLAGTGAISWSWKEYRTSIARPSAPQIEFGRIQSIFFFGFLQVALCGIKRISKEYQKNIKRASKEYQKSIKRVSKEYQKNIKRVSKEYQKSIKRVSTEYQKSIKRVSKEYRKSIKRVSKEYQKSIKRISKEYQKSIARQATHQFEDPENIRTVCLCGFLHNPYSGFRHVAVSQKLASYC